jgi:hypothetical protein
MSHCHGNLILLQQHYYYNYISEKIEPQRDWVFQECKEDKLLIQIQLIVSLIYLPTIAPLLLLRKMRALRSEAILRQNIMKLAIDFTILFSILRYKLQV